MLVLILCCVHKLAMSCFIAIILDSLALASDNINMAPRPPTKSRPIAATVRQRIERGEERLWRLEDFSDLPSMAVVQSLSRLARAGFMQRVSKGIYYRPRQTAFGPSRPNPAAMQNLVSRRKAIFPSGITAANLLRFTTQNPGQREVATCSLSLPRKLIGRETTVHARRPEAWASLSETDAALLDFLRRRGETSELSPAETIRRLLKLMSEKGRFERLLKIVDSEPPRVRAMLGAIGEQVGKRPKILQQLRASLNPLSRFDFGVLAALDHADHGKRRIAVDVKLPLFKNRALA